MRACRAAVAGLLGLWVGFWPGVVTPASQDPTSSSHNAAAADSNTQQPTAAEKLVARQQQIADDFQHLQDVLLRMIELTEASDPHRALLLRKAIRQSQQRLIALQFQSLVELLKEDRLSQAIQKQEALVGDLQALLELLLTEDRARRVASEKARIGQYLKRLNQIIKLQKGLQGRTAAGESPKPLADQQEKLAQKTGRLAQDIQKDQQPEGRQPEDTRTASPAEPRQPLPANQQQNGAQRQGPAPGQPKGKTPAGQPGQAPGQSEQPKQTGQQSPEQAQASARQRIQAARDRMQEAQQKLQEAQREGAVDKQEEAIHQLEQAKADLERILRQLREEEIQRMLMLLEARLLKMLGMQRQVYEGTVRLHKVPQPERGHDEEIQAGRLSRQEAQIVLEADKALALLREDGTAVAFPEALQQARLDMVQVVQRLDQVKVGRITQAIEEEIIAGLEEMIEAVKRAQDDARRRRQQMSTLPVAPQDQPLVDLLSELKMVRALQMRVNRRTQRYGRLIQGEQARDPDLLEALRQLARRQERISQIARDLQSGKNR